MEDNRSSISYDENWQDVTEPEYPVILDPGQDALPGDKAALKRGGAGRTAHGQLLLTIQLIACVLLALAAFVLKGVGGAGYHAVREWYYTQLNRSAIFDGYRDFDFSALLRLGTADEAQDTEN